jgi:hypothetical protein
MDSKHIYEKGEEKVPRGSGRRNCGLVAADAAAKAAASRRTPRKGFRSEALSYRDKPKRKTRQIGDLAEMGRSVLRPYEQTQEPV